MSEENQKQQPQELTKFQRDSINNANTIKNAAEVAASSGHPVAAAIGNGVKIADKISGGKASEKLGKQMAVANKFAHGGKSLQKLSNMSAESGIGDKVGQAFAAKNGNMQGKGTNGPQAAKAAAGNSKSAKLNSLGNKGNTSNNKVTDETNTGGGVNFTISKKIVKKIAIAAIPVFVVIIFCCLIISASQVFLNSISLGEADSLSGEEVEDKINNKGTDGLDEEKSDEDVAYDIYIGDEYSNILKNNKLGNYNIVQVSKEVTYKKRKYNEATLDRLEDFYPGIVDASKNYDENMVYDFYFKMYKLYILYRDTYKVHIDLPLLMATLNLESADKYVIFNSNLDSRYRTDDVNDMPLEELDYYYDWTVSDYKISRNKSEHDMEILVQNMISKQVKEACVDSTDTVVKENILRDGEIGTQTLTCGEGETYETEELGYVIDNKKYKEFLREFLEKKYYLEGEHDVTSKNINPDNTDNNSNGNNQENSSNNNNDNSNNNSENNNGGTYVGDVTTCALTVIGDKYYKTVRPATSSCNVPGFYDDNSWGLEPSFYRNVMALIEDGKAHGCNAAIISGHRTYAKQQYFYNCYLSGSCNNGNLAAAPGYSNHEYGIAADLQYITYTNTCLEFYRTNAPRFGLHYPLWYHSYPENWHIEPVNIIVGTP